MDSFFFSLAQTYLYFTHKASAGLSWLRRALVFIVFLVSFLKPVNKNSLSEEILSFFC